MRLSDRHVAGSWADVDYRDHDCHFCWRIAKVRGVLRNYLIPFVMFFTLMGAYIGQNNSTGLLMLVGVGLCGIALKFANVLLTPLLIGDRSLYQQSAARLKGEGFKAPVIITNSDFRFIVTQQLSDINIDPGPVLIEPAARNIAPAVLAAAIVVAQSDPDALILASPSDHYIKDVALLRDSIFKGIDAAVAGQVVTFGVTLTRAETGYGYLETDGAQNGTNATMPLLRFVEKPNADTAAKMLATGQFLWNAGSFLCKASTLIDACRTHAPALLDAAQDAVTNAQPDLGFLRLEQDAWARCDNISIDFAVMEKADNLAVVTQHGDSLAVECKETLLRSEKDGLQLVGLGLDNIVAITMKDAVLVADRSRVADLGKVVE